MIKYIKLLSVLILLLLVVKPAKAVPDIHLELEFNQLTNRDGLSNGQVNAILRDKRGYIWLGTMSGLDRYDGFRFKNFFYKNLDSHSISSNSVDEIQQDVTGNLWIHTSVGYCIYEYDKERFDREPEKWLKKVGIDGSPSKVLIDSRKNMWFVMYGRGCYFLDTKIMKSRFISFQQMGVKDAKGFPEVTSLTEQQGTAILAFRNGTLCRLSGDGKVLWTNPYLTKHYNLKNEETFCYVDYRSNYWVYSNSRAFIYSSARKKWYEGMTAFLEAEGIAMQNVTNNKIIVSNLVKDKQNRLWVATDHDGFFIIDYAHKKCKQYVKREGVTGSIPDNSLKKIYIDTDGAVWIGTYKNGIAYYSPSFTKFSTINLGDICTITQDKMGNYWCGTNDAGIICYNPITKQSKHFGMEETGLKSNIVVSSITMSDGTMYFGTFNGGMARYRDGQWKAYYATPGGLANQSVWTFGEDKYHRLLIGTLGSGVQFMDTKTETFKTLDISNSKLPSNYISSFSNMSNGDVLVGHSQNLSVINIHNFQVTNYTTTRGGKSFPSPAINDAIVDSRGIFWMASPAGMTMYDPKTGQMEWVNELNGSVGAVGCSVVEDKAKTIWLISEFIVTHVKLSKNNKGKWELNMTSYNSMDGLQDRQFNYRACYLDRNGMLILGGQDGINSIRTQMERSIDHHATAMFSGLVLFDHPLDAGEEYEGRVVLDRALDVSRHLVLSYKDNAFSIQLASSDVSVPSRCRFLYKMEGVADKWMMTPPGRPEITFTNLSSGSYTLQVKVVNGDGTVCDEVSELKIDVRPPFYLSVWALMIYAFMACGAVYFYRKRALDRQKIIFEREKMEENIRKDRELNELKLNFFTNVSHELRTPLMLIISPLANIIKHEDDSDKKRKMEMIHRNAQKLLSLVNQILDFRKIEQDRGKLTLTQVNAIDFIENICRSFQLLGNNKIKLIFTSTVKQLMMSVDVDKVGKIVNNLLSNAYKFTPDNGSVTVSLEAVRGMRIRAVDKDVLRIKVADTGRGISDDDKKRIFDRFYQVNGTEMQPMGGSGIGLNLVKAFTDLHGGTVEVSDNPGGGTVFTVNIPLCQDADKEIASTITSQVSTVSSQTSTEDTSLPTDKENIKIIVNPDKDKLEPSQTSTGAGKSSMANNIQSKPRLLLVDDSDDFREFMNEILSENYIVEEAVNGKEGWEKLQNQPLPDIILSDVMMPVMDGNEFCRLAKHSAATADIPFVMLTARLATEHKKEGLESGADDYITKPFDIDFLNLRLQNLMKWSQRKSVSVDSSTTETKSDLTQHPLEDTPDKIETPQVEEYRMTEADKKFLNNIDIYIRDNMSDPDTTVESMSAHLCISRVQLYKRMVSLTGTTPSEYLRAKRIHRSEELLRGGEFTVSEIAYKVGFNNPRYFSKYFQEEYGMTPSQYKKKFAM